MYQWIKQQTFWVQPISKLYKFRRPAAKPKRQISWIFQIEFLLSPRDGTFVACSFESDGTCCTSSPKSSWRNPEFHRHSLVKLVSKITQDHHCFQSFSASFVVQGTWLGSPQRCHHPQRPDVAPHVLPRCLLRWLFELVIDRDHDPGTKRIGGAFQNFLWFPTLQDGTPLSALCFSAADMLTDQRLFLCLLYVQWGELSVHFNPLSQQL